MLALRYLNYRITWSPRVLLSKMSSLRSTKKPNCCVAAQACSGEDSCFVNPKDQNQWLPT
jgi:hypothetical protein